MPFITDPDLDHLMGRQAPGSGAFAALLCLAQLTPNAPVPLEVLIQALNAWWDDQHDDLMTMLEGLEERDRVIITEQRTGTTITVMPELLPEVERQLAAISDEQQRVALLAGVRADIDTALTELVFDVGDPSPAAKEAWCRMFIPHLRHRVADNLELLPALSSVLAHYEPTRFDAIGELIFAYLDALPTFDTADVEEADDSDDAHVKQAFVAMHVEMLLQDACLAVEGVRDAELRSRYHASARAIVEYIEHHHLERSLSGRLHYASLRQTPLDEAQALFQALFERVGGSQTDPQRASPAHRVAALWLRRLRQEASDDAMLAHLLPFVTEVAFTDSALDERDPEVQIGVAECRLEQVALAIEAGEMRRARSMLSETLDVIAEGADSGAFDDDTELVDRLIADINRMQARIATQHGDIVQARQCYTAAVGSLRREHGRQHQLVRQLETERRRLSGKRARQS